MTTGAQISSARNSRGWTQQQLSDESGISLRTIQRIEKDQVEAQFHTLQQLEKVLGISLGDGGSSSHVQLFLLMGISVLFCPVPVLGNILIPLVIVWIKKPKGQLKIMSGSFVVYQILWTVVMFISEIVMFNLAVFIWGESNPGNFSPITMVFVFFWLLNLLVMMLIIQQAKRQNYVFLRRFPSFFRG